MKKIFYVFFAFYVGWLNVIGVIEKKTLRYQLEQCIACLHKTLKEEQWNQKSIIGCRDDAHEQIEVHFYNQHLRRSQERERRLKQQLNALKSIRKKRSRKCARQKKSIYLR